MPKLGNKKYPYTAKGKAAYKKALDVWKRVVMPDHNKENKVRSFFRQTMGMVK